MAGLAAPYVHINGKQQQQTNKKNKKKKHVLDEEKDCFKMIKKFLWHFNVPFLHPFPIPVMVSRRVAYVLNVGL